MTLATSDMQRNVLIFVGDEASWQDTLCRPETARANVKGTKTMNPNHNVNGRAGLAARGDSAGPGRRGRRGLAARLGRLAAVAAATDRSRPPAKAKSVIQVFLWGGMSHIDTWDPKPAAGRDYMGEFGDVIDTNVPGIQLGALFPKLAKQADKFSLIRSMTHGNNGHETAAYLMQTGHVPGERLAYPSVGAVVHAVQGPRVQRA